MKLWKLASVALALFSFNSNASIINTLNGTNYEWLELTETQWLSRNQVEIMLDDPNSELFGYQYASRSLLPDLFLSYSSWYGLSGYRSTPEVINGMTSLHSDFGVTYTYDFGYLESDTTVEGDTVLFESYIGSRGLYGESSECGRVNMTCIASTQTYLDSSNNGVMTLQGYNYGWGFTAEQPFSTDVTINSTLYGSYLVRESITVVPLPSALWIFASGLIGLVGFARRKKA